MGKKSSWVQTTADVFHKDRPSDKYYDMQKEHKFLQKLIIDCFLQKGGGTNTMSIHHKVFLYFLIMFEKVNLSRYIFHHMIWALKESKKNDIRQLPYGRSLSEIFYQGGLLSVLNKNGVTSDDDLGTMTGKIINGRTLRYMNIVKKVIALEDDMKESDVVSNLMIDFPPEVLATFVISHFEETRDVINYNLIPPTMTGVPLKVVKKRKSKKVVVESKTKPKKLKKYRKAPKLIVNELALPAIQEEVADLGPVEVLISTRTRGGSTTTSSQEKPKDQKKRARKQIRQLKVSTYTKEEDVAVEASSLVGKKRSKKVAAETSSDSQTVVQTVAAENLHD